MCFQKRHRLNNVKYTIHRLSQTQIRATVAFDHLTRQASACVAVGREWWSGYHVAPSMANWLNWGRFLGTPILASRRQEQTGSDTVQRLHSKNVDSHGERVRRRGCWNARCFGRAKDASPAGKAPAQMHVGRENSPMPEPRLEQKNNYEIHVSCQEDSRRAIEECVSNFRTTHFLLMHLILHVESVAHGLSTLPRFSISSSKREETTPPHPSRLPLRQGIWPCDQWRWKRCRRKKNVLDRFVLFCLISGNVRGFD